MNWLLIFVFALLGARESVPTTFRKIDIQTIVSTRLNMAWTNCFLEKGWKASQGI